MRRREVVLCASSARPPAWMALLADSKALRQTVVHSGAGLPVRCVVAAQPIARGERIATVPLSHVIDGGAAARLLSARLGTAAYQRLVAAAAAVSTPDNMRFFATRDALLIAAAVHALLSAPADGSAGPLAAFARSWPTRVPPLGVLLHNRYADAAAPPPARLERRLRLGSATAALPRGGEAAEEARTELMVQAVERGGLAALRVPEVEAVAPPRLLANYYAGRTTALTPRQHASTEAPRAACASHAAVRELAQSESVLETRVVAPLAAALCGAAEPSDDDESDAALRESLARAHFLARSRCVNLRWREGMRHAALVPLLDMLNHSTDSNVTFDYSAGGRRPADGGVVTVTATRRVAAGDELTLDYTHSTQRQCLFERPAARGPRSAAAELRALERHQRYDTVDDDDEPQPEQPQRAAAAVADDGDEERLAEAEAREAAAWLWRFGFMRSSEEELRAAEKAWGKGLRRRLQHLTDARRKGRPGEFVVGVPEGLRHLREQREQLERERYNATVIFPPQRNV